MHILVGNVVYPMIKFKKQWGKVARRPLKWLRHWVIGPWHRSRRSWDLGIEAYSVNLEYNVEWKNYYHW